MRKLALTATLLASALGASAAALPAAAAEPEVAIVSAAPAALANEPASPGHYDQLVVAEASRPETLGSCRVSGPTRYSTYWAFSVTCTSGTGGIRSKLTIRTSSGVLVTDYGPCVGKYSGSPAYVYPPWYLGGMSGSSVWVANWASC